MSRRDFFQLFCMFYLRLINRKWAKERKHRYLTLYQNWNRTPVYFELAVSDSYPFWWYSGFLSAIHPYNGVNIFVLLLPGDYYFEDLSNHQLVNVLRQTSFSGVFRAFHKSNFFSWLWFCDECFSVRSHFERKKHDIGMNMWYWNNVGMNIFQWYDIVMNYLNWKRERWRRWGQHRVQVSTLAHDSDTCRGPEIQKYKITAQSKQQNAKIQKT